MLWSGAGTAVLTGDEISRARHVPPVGSLKERLRAIPQEVAKTVKGSVCTFVSAMRKQRQEFRGPQCGPIPPSSQQTCSRPSLLGGLWWCREAECATCLKMTNPTTSRGEPAAQGLLQLAQYGFVRAIADDRPLVEALAPEGLRDDYLKSYEETLKVYRGNLYGGSYKQKLGGDK